MSKTALGTALALCVCTGVALADDVNVIVVFHGRADGRILARHGGSATGDLGPVNAIAGRVPPGRLRALRAEAGVAYVEEDVIRQTALVPNDTYYAGYQADDLGLIRVPAAWDVSTGAGARVAVLDTGCQTNHPDITGKVKAKKNFTTGSSSDVSDKNGHGTHTAGTVGALANNERGVAGVGYNCELAIGKVLGNSGSGYSSWIIAGINWSWSATGGNAKIISMSLGSSAFSSAEQSAVDTAVGNGCLVIAAAGNSGSSSPFYPAAYDNSISVAAVDATGVLAGFSNYGSTVDIAAPGVSIASTYKGSGYALMSGTSMATPHVAGVAALVWASTAWNGKSSAEIRGQLLNTATLAVTGANAGTLEVIDAEAAVAPPPPPPPPDPPPAEEPTPPM